ncbi:unnamed protein product [Amoebophrya sp. A120]|nr:unnamed protein product [Amoebophrya sp. A120]|eukprot:GSA120T00005034001.1
MPVDLSISTKMAANALDLAQAAQWAVKPLKEDATNLAIRINLAAEKIAQVAKNLEKFVYTVPVPHFPSAIPTLPKAGLATYTTPPPGSPQEAAAGNSVTGGPTVDDLLSRAKNVNSFLEIGRSSFLASPSTGADTPLLHPRDGANYMQRRGKMHHIIARWNKQESHLGFGNQAPAVKELVPSVRSWTGSSSSTNSAARLRPTQFYNGRTTLERQQVRISNANCNSAAYTTTFLQIGSKGGKDMAEQVYTNAYLRNPSTNTFFEADGEHEQTPGEGEAQGEDVEEEEPEE